MASCTTMMARFIDQGIDVNTKNDDVVTVLHLLSQRYRAYGVRMLLDEEAYINEATTTAELLFVCCRSQQRGSAGVFDRCRYG